MVTPDMQSESLKVTESREVNINLWIPTWPQDNTISLKPGFPGDSLFHRRHVVDPFPLASLCWKLAATLRGEKFELGHWWLKLSEGVWKRSIFWVNTSKNRCVAFSFDLITTTALIPIGHLAHSLGRFMSIDLNSLAMFDNFADCKVLVDWIRQPLVMESSSYLDFSQSWLICDLECATVSCDKSIPRQKHTTGNELIQNNMHTHTYNYNHIYI